MKTIFVAYTHFRLGDTEAGRKKWYPFVTQDKKIKVGQMFRCSEYDTPMQIVHILPKAFKYVNLVTGELSNTITSSNQRPIREVDVVAYPPKRQKKFNLTEFFGNPRDEFSIFETV